MGPQLALGAEQAGAAHDESQLGPLAVVAVELVAAAAGFDGGLSDLGLAAACGARWSRRSRRVGISMSSQPRQPVGARTGEKPAGGRWTHKTIPDIKEADVGFNNGPAVPGGVGPVFDWNERVTSVGDAFVLFERRVETDSEGSEVTVITSDCEPADMVLLARKGDAAYWNGDVWCNDHQTRRTWSADIALSMFQQGLISTGSNRYSDGCHAAVSAAGSPQRTRSASHGLIRAVAQIRGLRLLQSMAPSEGWSTTLGGYQIPRMSNRMLYEHFIDTHRVYQRLVQPPWHYTDPPDTPWGPQTVAGHATNLGGHYMFVGENSDLLWRALTETDQGGSSPLKQGIVQGIARRSKDMIAAAALHDETAAQQLTTGLFVGVEPIQRAAVHRSVGWVFAEALQPRGHRCRWTDEQQHKLAEFVDIVEALEP